MQLGLCTGLLVLTNGQENLLPSPSQWLNTYPDIYVLFTQGLEGCLKFVQTGFISCRFDGSSRSQGTSEFHVLRWQVQVGWGHTDVYTKNFLWCQWSCFPVLWCERLGHELWRNNIHGQVGKMNTQVQTIRSICLTLKNFENAGDRICILCSFSPGGILSKICLSLSLIGFYRGRGK